MVVTRVEYSAGEGNEWRQWQWTGMLMERTGGISIVGGGEDITIEEMGKGDRVGKSELLGDRVCMENQSSACSVERRQMVHPRVVMLEGDVVGDEGQEDKVMVEVNEWELIVYNGRWFYR